MWLKDGKGGERSTTVDISAHGVSVRSTRDRPLRQYVELELTLPGEERIALTAMVARGDGRELGLELFKLEARAKQRWQGYLAELARSAPAEAPEPSVAPTVERAAPPSRESSSRVLRQLPERASSSALVREPSLPDAVVPETPVLVVKPSDLGRMWAFYRGELARGRMRLECPIRVSPGLVVEVLVVHPDSGVEWSLSGEVTACQPGRGTHPIVDVELVGLDTAVRATFRSFVATGVAPEATPLPIPVFARPIDEEEEAYEPLPSVMIDIDEMSDEMAASPIPSAFESEETTVISGRPQAPEPSRAPASAPVDDGLPELDADVLELLDAEEDELASMADDEDEGATLGEVSAHAVDVALESAEPDGAGLSDGLLAGPEEDGATEARVAAFGAPSLEDTAEASDEARVLELSDAPGGLASEMGSAKDIGAAPNVDAPTYLDARRALDLGQPTEALARSQPSEALDPGQPSEALGSGEGSSLQTLGLNGVSGSEGLESSRPASMDGLEEGASSEAFPASASLELEAHGASSESLGSSGGLSPESLDAEGSSSEALSSVESSDEFSEDLFASKTSNEVPSEVLAIAEPADLAGVPEDVAELSSPLVEEAHDTRFEPTWSPSSAPTRLPGADEELSDPVAEVFDMSAFASDDEPIEAVDAIESVEDIEEAADAHVEAAVSTEEDDVLSSLEALSEIEVVSEFDGMSEAADVHDPDPATEPLPKSSAARPATGLFAAFFEEAAREQAPSAAPASRIDEETPAPPQSTNPRMPSAIEMAKVPEIQVRTPRGPRPSAPGSVVVTAAPLQRVVKGEADHGGLRPVESPDGTPGAYFEFDEPVRPALPVKARVGPFELHPRNPPGGVGRVRRRAADERMGSSLQQPGSSAGTNPGLDRDIALARARVVRSPEDADAAQALASLLFSRGRAETLAEAVSVFEKVARLRPDAGEPHARLGELHARAGRYAKARASLERAAQLGVPVDPDIMGLVDRALRYG